MTSSAEPTPAVAIPTSGAEPRAALGGVREVSRLAYPVVLTQISITLTQLVDSAMVGRLGATELAAVGFGGIWMWTAMCFFIGTATAVQTFVSQHHGAGEERDCGGWSWQGLYAVLPMAVVVAFALLFGAEPLMRWLGPSEELQPLASVYVSTRALGAIGLTAATCFGALFRGIGDTRTPLYAMVLANVVNAVLDYGLIFGRLGLPQWGVAGAGVATAIAEWIYLFALLAALSRPRMSRAFITAPVRFSLRKVRRLLSTGLPIGGQWCLEMTSFAAFTTLVARMGDAPMAASQAFVMLLALSFMQCIGISIAVATLVGRYIGAGELDAAQRSFGSGMLLGLGLAGGIAVLYVAIPEQLLRIFTDDPAVLALARPLLLVGAVFQLFDAFAIVADGALRGAGDTRWPFFVRFALAWGLFLPLGWLFGFYFEGGLTGAWIGGLIYVLALASVLVLRFRSGAWRKIQI